MYRFPIGTCLWSLVSASLIFLHYPVPVRALPSTSVSQSLSPDSSTIDSIPQAIVDAVRWDLSIELGTHPERISVVRVGWENWPDSCLGLSLPGELCSQQIIPGWRITLSDGQYTRAYRTDRTGQQRRLETGFEFPSPLPPPSQSTLPTVTQPSAEPIKPPSVNNLPDLVAQAILKDLARRRRLPLQTLDILEATPEIWPDTCLGLQLWNSNCKDREVEGWRVVLSTPHRRWVYRSDGEGQTFYPEPLSTSSN